jgi:hypothetical protein
VLCLKVLLQKQLLTSLLIIGDFYKKVIDDSLI